MKLNLLKHKCCCYENILMLEQWFINLCFQTSVWMWLTVKKHNLHHQHTHTQIYKIVFFINYMEYLICPIPSHPSSCPDNIPPLLKNTMVIDILNWFQNTVWTMIYSLKLLMERYQIKLLETINVNCKLGPKK